MIPSSSCQNRDLSRRSWVHLALLGTATLLLAGCAGTQSSTYQTVAYQPTSLNDVQVKVSLSTQNVYVEEGNQLIMATPTCVGRPGFLTPTGHYKVILKDKYKRSETYGYWVNGSQAFAGKSSANPGPGWTYIGYPMAFWVEFADGFGFHEGPIWPYPRSHGCLHLHPTASAKFFELVQVGTPVEIAQTLPEDAIYGRDVKRPTDYADPDPPASLMISRQFFDEPRDTTLVPTTPAAGTAPATTVAPAPSATAAPASAAVAAPAAGI